MELLSDFLLDKPELLLDETRLHNALHDFFATDIASLNVIMMAYRCIDIAKQAQIDHPHLDIEKENWKKRLRYNYSIKSDKASWAVEQWITIFSDDLKQRLIDVVNQQQVKQRKLVSLIRQVEQLIDEDKYTEAENILDEINNQGIESDDRIKTLWTEINKAKKDTKSQKLQALEAYGNGQFDSYNTGIERIAHILDICPNFQQAHIWLKNNPRENPINNPLVVFAEGSSQCTISWKDDDPYSKYTVCRAVGHHPQDPNDGYCVCSEISNTRVTDSLPLDQPGSIWKYSIFAIRILDKQWIKTECNKDIAWLPNPSDFKAEVGKDTKGRPIITLSWKITADNCQGVHILRYDNDNNPFIYSSNILDLDTTTSSKHEAQVSRCLVDEDVYSGITYRYRIMQVWKKGKIPLESSGISLEVAIQ